MAANYGVGGKFSLNHLHNGMGVYAISENAAINSNPSSHSFFGYYLRNAFPNGLLCL